MNGFFEANGAGGFFWYTFVCMNGSETLVSKTFYKQLIIAFPTNSRRWLIFAVPELEGINLIFLIFEFPSIKLQLLILEQF